MSNVEPGLGALFAGQLSEHVGMGRDLLRESAAARRVFERAEELCRLPLRRFMLEGPEGELAADAVAQPAVFALGCAIWDSLAEKGLRLPGAVAGYSLGNYAALVACGAIELEPAMDVVLRVLELVRKHRLEGGMAAVIGLAEGAVRELCAEIEAGGEWVEPANLNADNQIVVAGSRRGVDRFVEAVEPRCLKVLPLPMTLPIHSRLMQPVSRDLAEELVSIPLRPPRIPFYSTSFGRRVDGVEEIRAILVEQVMRPSLWSRTVQALIGDGYRRFVEIGSGSVLTRMLRWIDRTVECAPVGSVEDYPRGLGRVQVA